MRARAEAGGAAGAGATLRPVRGWTPAPTCV